MPPSPTALGSDWTTDLSTSSASTASVVGSSGSAPPAAHDFGGLQRPRTTEHGQPAQQDLLVLTQQVVAPVDQRAQRLMPTRRGRTAAGQHLELIVQASRKLLGRQHVHPGRRQLQRKRDTVQPSADVDDRRRGVSIQRKRLVARARAIHEQTDRFDATELFEVGLGVSARAARATAPARWPRR